MKKFVALIATAALFMGFSIASATAAVKTGDICKKAGTVTIVKGFKYTCTAQGKKKVWSKGVRVVADSASKSTPTPYPSPSPKPIPSSTPVLTLAQQWQATGSRALEGLGQAFPPKSGQFPQIETIWRMSEKVDPQISAEIQRQYRESIAFWSAYTKHEGVLQIIIGTLDDIDFVCKWRNEYLSMQDSGCRTGFRTDKSRSWDAHTTQLGGKATDFYFMTDPATLKQVDFLARVPHEFFHNVQFAQMQRYKYVLPCWAEEAGAEYFGNLIGSEGDAEKFLRMRYRSISAPMGAIPRSELAQSDWKKWLNSTDMNSIVEGQSGWGCQSVQMEGIYHYGLLATEYINIKLGTAGLLTLYKDAGTMGWDKAVEKSFNKSKSEAYDEIAQYMSQEYRITMAQRIVGR